MKLNKQQISALSNKIAIAIKEEKDKKPIPKNILIAIDSYFNKKKAYEVERKALSKKVSDNEEKLNKDGLVLAKKMGKKYVPYSMEEAISSMQDTNYVTGREISNEIVLSLAFSKETDMDSFINNIVKKFI